MPFFGDCVCGHKVPLTSTEGCCPHCGREWSFYVENWPGKVTCETSSKEDQPSDERPSLFPQK